MDKPTGYIVNKSPGHKCLRCGADISHRVSSTKYCLDCSKQIAQDRNKIERKYVKALKMRDAILTPEHIYDCIYICKTCRKVVYSADMFCKTCGQRLKEDNDV